MNAKKVVIDLFKKADIEVNGARSWDIQVHNDQLYSRLLSHGSLGLGEAYMEKWWDEEVNIQPDHVHLMLSIPPKYAVSEIMGFLKGKIAIRLFQHQRELTKLYWGKHVWSRGHAGILRIDRWPHNEEQIRKYVKWQQERDQRG